MLHKHKYKILGGVTGATLGFVHGNVPGAIIGGGIGYGVGKLRDENRQSEIPKYLKEKIQDF